MSTADKEQLDALAEMARQFAELERRYIVVDSRETAMELAKGHGVALEEHSGVLYFCGERIVIHQNAPVGMAFRINMPQMENLLPIPLEFTKLSGE